MNKELEDYKSDLPSPDQTITVGGKIITVREFGFMQAMKLGKLVKPIIIDMIALFEDPQKQEISLSDFFIVFSENCDELLELMSESTGESCEWIKTLSDADGQLLTMVFWSVNKGYFARRLVTDKAAGKVKTEVLQSAGDNPKI